MASQYEYYKDLCQCPGTHSSGAGSNGSSVYDYYSEYCICDGESRVQLEMRDLDDNVVTNYPVTVHNILEATIGYATTKAEYIQLWNLDPDNQVIGTLSAGNGPFSFLLLVNAGQVAPPWVLGTPDEVETGIYESVYASQYE